jgi:hypothetical protein
LQDAWQCKKQVTVPETNEEHFVLGGLVVIVLETGSRVRRFKPGREQQISKGNKKPAARISVEGK